MGTTMASGDFDGTGGEGSMTPDNEKVRLFLHVVLPPKFMSLVLADRFVLRLVVKGENPICVGAGAWIENFQWLSGRRVF